MAGQRPGDHDVETLVQAQLLARNLDSTGPGGQLEEGVAAKTQEQRGVEQELGDGVDGIRG